MLHAEFIITISIYHEETYIKSRGKIARHVADISGQGWSSTVTTKLWLQPIKNSNLKGTKKQK